MRRERLLSLERRARATADRANGEPLTIAHERTVVLLVEGQRPIATPWDVTMRLWRMAGIEIPAESVADVERLFAAGQIPGVYVVGAWVHVAAIEVRPCARGGRA